MTRIFVGEFQAGKLNSLFVSFQVTLITAIIKKEQGHWRLLTIMMFRLGPEVETVPKRKRAERSAVPVLLWAVMLCNELYKRRQALCGQEAAIVLSCRPSSGR